MSMAKKLKLYRIKYSCVGWGDDAIKAESPEQAEELFAKGFKDEDQLEIDSVVEININDERYIGSEHKTRS